MQVGAFRRAANAAETQRRLESLGIPVFVEQQGALQVVNAGPYASRDDAERASLRLRNAGIENYLFGQSTAHETTAPAGRYVVQAGAFRDPANARQLAGRLRRAGELPFTIVSGHFTLVRIGPFGSLRAARAANARMQKRGLKGVVLTR